MGKGRLEAFTDGVIAIIITIMVLEMKVPAGDKLSDLASYVPMLLTYALSYINIGLIWNNHHHMLQVTEKINGRILWINLSLLFWMSLIPLSIRWINEMHFTSLPTASYGVVFIGMGLSYFMLEKTIIKVNGPQSKLAQAIGGDIKTKVSLSLYVIAVPLSFVNPLIAIGLYIGNACLWLIPDKRIESVV